MTSNAERIERLRERVRPLTPDRLTRPIDIDGHDLIALLAEYNDQLEGYEAWKASGQAQHRALLDIWHAAEPGDTKHMTFGLDPQAVVESVNRALTECDDQRRKIDAALALLKKHGIKGGYAAAVMGARDILTTPEGADQ